MLELDPADGQGVVEGMGVKKWLPIELCHFVGYV